jgi:hypothetical protein
LSFRHEQGSSNETLPRFTDRLVLDRSLRGRLGPGGTLNPEEDCKEAELYLRNQGRSSAPSTLTYSPNKQQPVSDQLKRDELARHFMYTSVQQAAFDEIPWGLLKFSSLRNFFSVLCRFKITYKITNSINNI